MVFVNRYGSPVLPLVSTPPTNTAMSKLTTLLNNNWSFAQVGNDPVFRPVESVPTEIFLDLLAHKLIADPFPGKNELDVQWVGEEDWIYRVVFATPTKPGRTDIVFEGLDTYAVVTLNGEVILSTDNMFTPYRVDITDRLRKDADNELSILFESAFLHGKKVREEHKDFYWGSWNGDESRLAVRKSQYHYVCMSTVGLIGAF